jgi:lysosomal alpha-mannosidase
LLRLEHLQDKDDDSQLSKPVTLSLKSMFSAFDIISAKETSLGANQWVEQVNRMTWPVESNEIKNTSDDDVSKETEDDDLSVTLKPMEIRTYIVDVEWK